MSSGNKRRFFDRDSSPVVATDDDFDAVFGSATEQPASTAQDIPIERIRRNPFQARVKFKDIDTLAASMRTHGFTSRLRVRRDPAQPQFFQLVYGERRLRAAQAAGIKLIPCDVAQYSDEQMREVGLTENLQRSDLEPLEEARAFRTAIDEGGYSIRSLAAQIGKSKGYVQGRLDVLRGPDDVLQMVDEHPDTFTAGLLIARLPSAELRQSLIARVLQGALDKEMLRGVVRDVIASGTPPPGADAGAWEADAQPSGAKDVLKPADLRDRSRPTGAASNPRSGSEVEQNRTRRQSTRALKQATQTLRAMIMQLQSAIPELQPAERSKLLDFIAQRHFPELEAIIEQLRVDER